MNSKKSSAIEYAEEGFYILPVFHLGPNGQCTCPKPMDCSSPGKHPFTPLVKNGVKDATSDLETVEEWWSEYPKSNIGMATGSVSGIIAIDIDGEEGEQSWSKILNGTPINTPVCQTGKGKHIIFKAPEKTVNNGVRVRPGIDIRADGGYIVVPPSDHITGTQYEWKIPLNGTDPQSIPDEIWEVLNNQSPNSSTEKGNTTKTCTETIDKGTRNETLTSIAGSMRNRGLEAKEILPSLKKVNERRCDPPLNQQELKDITESVSSYKPGNFSVKDLQEYFGTPGDWPDPIGEEGYHGVAGDIVQAIEPHSEADPAALLFSLLAGFGNLVNSDCYLKVGGDKHPLRLWPVLVGKTSKARKGMSWKVIKDLFTTVDETWNEREKNGLRSGAGFVHHIRDEDGSDPGVEDKRLVVLEGEFSSVLRSMEMDGNTLSPLIRKAWGLGPNEILQNMTKTNPEKSTGAHVSIIGHITKRELKKYLTSTEAGNGFGNRFLWVCVKRAQELPFGGELNTVDFEPMMKELKDALKFSKGVKEIKWSEKAKPLWEQRYKELSKGNPGVVGAVTSRAEPYVLRIASTYAILDCSRKIQLPHLKAGLELWRYCRDSAYHIFGQKTGNKLADRILKIVRDKNGLSRTEIFDALNRNKSKEEIDEALGVLKGSDRIYEEQQKTGGPPRTMINPIRKGGTK